MSSQQAGLRWLVASHSKRVPFLSARHSNATGKLGVASRTALGGLLSCHDASWPEIHTLARRVSGLTVRGSVWDRFIQTSSTV